MRPVAAFEAVADGDGQVSWRLCEKPPCLVSWGRHDFVVASSGRRGTRAYINGCRVYGLAVVRPGDFVLVRKAGSLTTYRYGGRMAAAEPGAGQLCAFTRRPVEGPAIRCPCGTLVGQAVAEQIGRCPGCGRTLGSDVPSCPAEEELL
jgi:hypothetical protein